MEPADWLDDEAPPLLPAPLLAAERPAWRQRLERWRAATHASLRYSGALYTHPAYAWVPATFACGFVLVYDRLFYDPRGRQYTPGRLLRHARRAFGGFEAVVLWHAYPRLGFDDRNQFDFYRDLPGGLAGLRAACQHLQAHGVRVFLNYNPWDTGTRREAHADADVLTGLLQALGADGIFLDTLDQDNQGLFERLAAARPGAVLESEGALPLARVTTHAMSWAQEFADTPAPGVLRNKWFERRHMLHTVNRWQGDHTPDLHLAWMNGCGVLVWENVFGTWAGWSARDRSLLRALLPIQRRYAHLFSTGDWTPLVETLAPGMFASKWARDSLRLWTLVNRNDSAVRGELLAVPYTGPERYFDLVAGRECKPLIAGGVARLTGELGPRGVGAVLAAPRGALGPGFAAFLRRQARAWLQADFDPGFPARTVVRRLPPRTRPASPNALPAGMVALPGAQLELTTTLRARECGFYDASQPGGFGVPVLHTEVTLHQAVRLAPFAIDLTPVTNAQYAHFLAASGHRPADQERLLHHWAGGKPPARLLDHPVVYVDLDDARAYARWAGKRLPTEAEWQYAAQGSDGRRYPWGPSLEPGRCNGGQAGTTPVEAFPAGRSPWGCFDMCGNVWHWTESEHDDGRTRFAMLRGGSFYHAQGSDWYADGGPQPCGWAAKFLLMWPGLDRCATIGFRCVVDLSAA